MVGGEGVELIFVKFPRGFQCAVRIENHHVKSNSTQSDLNVETLFSNLLHSSRNPTFLPRFKFLLLLNLMFYMWISKCPFSYACFRNFVKKHLSIDATFFYIMLHWHMHLFINKHDVVMTITFHIF